MSLRPSDGRHERGRRVVASIATGDGRFVFSRSLRHIVGVYVAVAVLACLFLTPPFTGDRAYVEAMVIVSCACSLPGVLISWRTSRRVARADRLVWRLWIGGFVLGCLTTARLISMSDAMFERVRQGSVAAAVVLGLLLAATNTVVLRSRSGQRTVLIDVADIAMAIVAVVAPLVVLAGRSLATSGSAWFSISAGIWLVVSLYGTAVAAVLYFRIEPHDRALARFGLIFGATASLACISQMIIGVSDFSLPPGPFLATHALCAGFTVLFFLHATEQSSIGLERLPARAQVRRRPAVTLLVLLSIPVLGASVWLRRDQEWTLAVALAAAGALVALFCVRGLLAARETRLLYREVERSADERAELLTDVLAQAEADRHRVATHLHRQSVQLYTALATVTEPLGRADPASDASVRVAERLRVDLRRQSDELRRFALAVRPPCDEPGRGSSITTLLRVQLDGLYPEGRRPSLVAEVDPDLLLDWTDEAILARVAEDALRILAGRSPGATAARLGLGIDGGDLVLDLELDDPAPRDPAPPGPAEGAEPDGTTAPDSAAPGPLDPDGAELATVRAGAELLGASVSVTGSASSIGIALRSPIGGHRPPVPFPPLRAVE